MTLKNGVVIATFSMQDPYAIRAVDLEGAVVCEAGNCAYDAITRVQGRVSAKRGFVFYNGTLENSQLWYQNWLVVGQRPNDLGIKTYSLPTWVNRIEFPGGRNDPEIKRLEAFYTEDVFAMRVAAQPRPPRNRVLPEMQPYHIKSLVFPEHASIEVWIDPGYASAHALLWVAVWDEPEKIENGVKVPPHKQFHIFDELYEQGKTVDDMVSLAKQNKHFAMISRGIIDIAAKGHGQGVESALEKYIKLMPRVPWNMKLWHEEPLIERIRTSAKSLQFTIDPKCVGLIAECGLGEMPFEGMHPWKYPTDKSGMVVGEKPIDRWNHSAKALGYGLLDHLGQVERLTVKSTKINRLRGKNRNRRPEGLGVNPAYVGEAEGEHSD